MIVFSSSSISDAESKIRSWIDNEDRTLLEDDHRTQKDVEICLKFLEQFEGVVVTSFGSNLPSRQITELKPASDLKKLDSSTMDSSTEEAGSVVDLQKKRFTEPKWIGTGAFGVIFKVIDNQLKIPVAIKLLRPSKSQSSDARQRFFSEAEITAHLTHPTIIRIYDCGTLGKLPYITTAYSELGSLASWLERSRKTNHSYPMTSKQACLFVAQIAEAIQYAHTRLTLHRDLKPGNILLFPASDISSDNVGFLPVVTDFGLSKRLETAAEKNLTQVGGILGTLRYMSPEQAIGRTDQIRTTSDIYSLGVILYELLTNKLPFDDPDDGELRRSIIYSEPIAPSVIHAGINRDLDAIVLKCLAKTPEDRYQTAQELAADLKRYLNGAPVLARRSNWMRTLVLAIRRYPIAAGLLAMLIAVSSFSAISIYRARANERQLTAWALRNSARVGSAFGDRILEGTRLTPAHLLSVIEPEIEALELQRAKNRRNSDLLRTLAVLRHYASICKTYQTDLTEAILERQRVIDLQEDLLKREPGNRLLRFQLATSYFWIGIFNSDNLKNHALALSQFKHAERFLDEIMLQDASNIDAADLRNAVYVHQGDALLNLSENELARASKQKAIRSAIELVEMVPSKPMVVTQAIYGLRSLANIDEEAGGIDSAETCYQQASELAERYFGNFWSEGWTVRETFHLFLAWALFELRHDRNEKAIAVLERWGSWYETYRQYVSVDGSPCLASKESGSLSILGLGMMANKKLGDSSAILTGTERIGELLQEMSDQQQQVESLRSYFLKIDEEFDLENYRIKS